jgi:hypothetical protein
MNYQHQLFVPFQATKPEITKVEFNNHLSINGRHRFIQLADQYEKRGRNLPRHMTIHGEFVIRIFG